MLSALLLLVLLAPPAPSPPVPPTPQALLAALQQRYDATRSLALDFSQTHVNRATGRRLAEAGTLLAEKPGRMRWEYHTPEPKLFLLDGDEGWFHIPEEGIVYKLKNGPEDERRLPALFLSGKGNLATDYSATREEGTGGLVLRLVPRHGGEDYDHIRLAIEPATLAIRAITVVDALGNETGYEFRNERLNLAIPPGSFEFRPPKGVEVIEPARAR